MTEAALVALDSNIIIYAEGLNDQTRQDDTRLLLDALGAARLILPTQVLGECFTVMTRKFAMPVTVAKAKLADWQRSCSVHAATAATFESALDLAAAHGLQFWDALILATSADAGCRLLLSEDMLDGFVWRGTTVANPFAARLHPLLQDAITSRPDARRR
jgi:predicted nucleic acid-binding protein